MSRSITTTTEIKQHNDDKHDQGDQDDVKTERKMNRNTTITNKDMEDKELESLNRWSTSGVELAKGWQYWPGEPRSMVSKEAEHEQKTYKVGSSGPGNDWSRPMRKKGWPHLNLETRRWAPGPLTVRSLSSTNGRDGARQWPPHFALANLLTCSKLSGYPT